MKRENASIEKAWRHIFRDWRRFSASGQCKRLVQTTQQNLSRRTKCARIWNGHFKITFMCTDIYVCQTMLWFRDHAEGNKSRRNVCVQHTRIQKKRSKLFRRTSLVQIDPTWETTLQNVERALTVSCPRAGKQRTQFKWAPKPRFILLSISMLFDLTNKLSHSVWKQPQVDPGL